MADTVDDYISGFPPDVQPILTEVRRRIHHAVPGAGEKISYQLPTVTVDGRALIYFAGWKSHVSLYPVGPADAALEAELTPYRAAKATLKFPLSKPMPYDLIERVAAYLYAQHT